MLAVGGHLMGELPDECIRMASGFTGGIGGSHEEICGAISGAVMVIGGLYGRVGPDEDDQVSQTLCAQYRAAFLHEFGVTSCGPLRAWVHEPAGPGLCSAVVERAASLLLEVIGQGRKGGRSR